MSEPEGTDRREFVARVRHALGRSARAPVPSPPVIDDAVARLTSPDADQAGTFRQRAEEVGMVVHRTVADRAAQTVIELLGQAGVKRVAVAAGDLPGFEQLAPRVEQAGFELVDWRKQGGVDALFDTDASVTMVDYGLAETGTLVCCSGAEEGRALSLVPPVHVALLPAGRIFADMIDLWDHFDVDSPDQLPSGIVLVTGPSKTADIEGVLVTGVHGPGQVHILVVEDQ